MEITPACPKCGSRDVLPIVYELPGPDLTEESITGTVALGGGAMSAEAPDHVCQHCGHEWRVGETDS
jgi:hypothetical protein